MAREYATMDAGASRALRMAIRKLAVAATDNGPPAPEVAARHRARQEREKHRGGHRDIGCCSNKRMRS
jgi:hypothetical protein